MEIVAEVDANNVQLLNEEDDQLQVRLTHVQLWVVLTHGKVLSHGKSILILSGVVEQSWAWM